MAVVVLALDGLDPDWLASLRRRGLTPCLDALRKQGVSGRLRSAFPPVSVPAWSTFLTGVEPGRHGLFDFTRLREGRVEFQNAADRGVPTVLELLDSAGLRVCSIGVPTTYPVSRLERGAILSGFDSPLTGAPDARAMHPLPLWKRLRGEGLDLRTSTLPEGRKGRGWHARAAAAITASIERRTAQTLSLLREGPWDLLMTHFQAADTAGHHFARYFDATSPRHDAAHERRARVLPDTYAALDAAVGKIFAACSGDTLRVVVSDHGMGPASDCVIHLNRWLEQEGFLRRSSNGPRLGLSAASLARRAALRHLPREVQARLFRLLRRGAAARLETRFRLGGIDLSLSAAFSEESSTLPGVWILDPKRREALIRRLRAWNGVTRVFRREDLYRGPLRHRAPDLLLELRHSLVKTPPGYAGPAIRRLDPADYDGERGAGLNGVHRPDGVIFAAGPGVSTAGDLNGAWIGDLAPSLLNALEVPIPDWMEGRPIPALPGQPRWAASGPDAPTAPRDPGLSPHEVGRVERRLRALGYLG